MPSYSTFTLDDNDASALVELLGREADCAVPEAPHERWKRIQAKITDGRYIASNDKLLVMANMASDVRSVLAEVIAHNLDIVERLGRYSIVPR